MGNITSRSDIAAGAAWTYDPTHKHQVTQAGSSAYTYSYDGNGNAKTRNGSTQSWTSYNYPSYVGTSTESASFDYGPDRQRWRMIYTGPSGTETTYYATPFLEEVATSSGTDYRHYVYAGSKPVVVISRTTAGAVTVRSLLSDHQGSISSIVADSTGTSYVSESFTAYGNRRESSTWTGSPTSTERTTMDGVTREGYTFQTVLGSMGLNHMNGRIEDAVTGRFLSSDPYIPDLSNTQSYNRYSYVNNNPLTTVDPTGFDGCSEEVASNYIGCGAGDGSLLPPVVVTGSPPGSTTTTINPGGYAVTAPDGGLTLVGTAPAPAKPTVPRASTTVTANPQPLPFYPSVNPLNVQSNLSQSQTSAKCMDLAQSLGFGPNYTAPSSSPIDDTWSIGTGVSLAGNGAMVLRGYVGVAGSRVIGGRSVGLTMGDIGTQVNVLGGLAIGVSAYQAIDAYSTGNTPSATLSGLDAAMGVAAFFPGADAMALSYGLTRILGDIGSAASSTPRASVLDRMGTLQAAGCL